MRRIAIAWSALLIATAATAQEFELSVPNIMLGPEHVGEPPSMVRWTEDGQWIYFRWKPGGQPWHEEPTFYRVRGAGGSPEQPSTMRTWTPSAVFLTGGDVSRDRRRKVVSHEGDLWLVDLRRQPGPRLTETRSPELNPTLSADGRTVYFTREDNLFALSLETGALRQLTDVRRGASGAGPIPIRRAAGIPRGAAAGAVRAPASRGREA
jgi:hypothetical protein